MTLEEIIKKQKEHLTKAQIGELIQATERYKQLNASNRASAMRTLSDQYRATRRGLQNTGLAGRKGKLVSGQEKAARIRANEAYRSYNEGLRQIDNAYAQNRAARMANETARENQIAEIEKIQEENDKEAARINAEYEAWLRKKKAAEDEYKRQQKEIERLRAQQQAQQQQIRERIEEDRTEQSGVVQGNRIQRLAKDKHPQLETSDYARAAQEQAVQRAVNEYQQTQKVFRQQREADAMYDAMHPGSAITRAPHTDDYVMEQKRVENARQLKVSGASDAEVWFADAYGVSPNRYKTVKNENPELIKELTGAVQDLRTKNYDTVINTQGNIYDKHQAREDKAKAESAISKAAVAMGIDDAEMRKLYLMNDTQFAVAFAAAAALAAARQKYDSSDAIQDQMMMSGKSGAFNNATRDAEMRLAKFDQVRRLRYDTADKTLYYDTYPTDVQTKDAKTVRSFCAINQNTTPYAWANPKNENGENWYQAAQNGWKAENDGNTKYGALVNDWSLVGGRQGMRYQQTGKVAALLANVMPHFYDLADETGTYSNAFEDTHVQSWAVHNGISTADYYDYVRNSCVKAFYGNNASHEDYEQMDAMLALANLMTDEERARFNELANGSYGAFANEADEYFEYLYKNVLPERFKAYVDELNGVFTDTTYGKIGQSALSVLTNLGEGITGPIHTLTTNYNDSVSAQLGAMKYTSAQAARESVSKDFSPIGKFFYDTGMSMADSASVAMISGGIGKMLATLGVPTAAVIGGKTVDIASKAGSVLGGSILGGSAFNSAYKEALDRGLSPDKARTVAVGQGFNEMLFESLSLDLLVSQFQKGGILKVSKNSFVNWFVNTMVQGGVEGSEEVFTDMANNLWDNKVNGIFSEELTKLREYIGNGMSYEDAKRKVDAEYAEQLGMSFLGGFVSGGVMGGAAGAMHNIQMRGFERYGAKMDADAKAEVRGFNFKDEQMQELAKQSKLTNQDYGVLAVARDQQLKQNALDYNAKLLKEGKITAEVKKLFDRFIESPGLVENQNGGLTDFNGNEVFTAEEVAQMAKYDKYLQNAVDIRGNQDALIQQREEQAQALAEQQKRLDNPLITNEERAQRVGQEFGTPQIGARERIAGDMAFQRGASDAAAASPSVNKSVIEGMKLKDAVTVKGNKVDTKKGVVTFDYGNNKTTDTMTNDQLIALRYAQRMAELTGSNIKVESEFVGKDKNADGFYNPDTDTVHINLKGKNSMVYTLAHELTHRIAKLNKAAYADLLKAVKEELSRSDLPGDALPEVYQDAIGKYMDGETSLLDALRKYEKEHYASNGIILDKDGGTKEVDEEIVCKCCETFLADPRFVQNMVTKHKTGAKAVYSFLKDVYNDMKALFGLAERNADEEGKGNAANISAESDILAQFGNIDRIFKLWSRAVKQMQKVKTQTKQTQTIDFSKMTDEDREAVGTKYSVRTESAPTKTQDVYKLMRLGKDGRLYPLFIDSAEGIDLGVWYNADSPDMSVLKTLPSGVYLIGDDGKDIVSLEEYRRTHPMKSTKYPSKEAINAATKEGKRWVYIEETGKKQRRMAGDTRKYWNLGINGSGSVNTYSMRPGWHAGSLPTMRQIGKGTNGNLRDDSFVWVKGRVSADVDYQNEADSNPDHDIPTHIPTNGFYLKATNADKVKSQADKVGWYVAGAFIADRIIGDAEARSVIDKWNAEHPSDHVEYDYERESGKEFDAESMTLRNKVSTDISTAIENNGVVVDKDGEPVLNVHDHGDGGVQYSYSTWKKEGRDTLKSFMKKDTENYAKKRRKELRESGMSKAEVKAIVDSEVADMRTQYERIMKQMDKIYDISEKYLDKYASFGTWSRADVTVDKDGKPVFSVIRANGEYPMNIDFSLVCVKRRALDAVLNEIVRRGFMEKLVLDGESLVKVNEIIRKRGFEIACMGCFVEAKRFRQQGVAEGFAEKYNEIVKSLGGEAAYANFGQDESVKQTEGITGKKDSELNWSRVNELIEQYNKKKAANSRAGMTVEEAIAFELKENPKSRVLLKSGDFMSTRGMDRVAKDAPSILTLYNKQKGTGGPKAVFGDMQYLNDVCKKQWNVNKAYAVGGVRVQSFSDFVPRMFFDYCQMIADLATRKLPAHAYTKEESFVRLYGLTGMKINMSLFPKVGSDGLSAGLQYMRDKNGDIVYKDGKPVKTYAWAGESFNYDVAKEIQADAAYGKNCGTIAVGISDEQIRMMMADPTIRMIIPYHKSSLNPVIAEMMGIQGFTDYTEYQRTKLDGKAIDVDFAFNQRLHEVGDPQAVVKEYLDWCKENGYTAKFEQFAYNADGSINENYYKLLEDFTLFDEQGNYCPQEAVQMVYPENMDTLLDKYLKRDNDMQEARDAMIPAVAQEIIRAMDKKASLSNTDFKSDKLGGQEYLKYLQLGTKVVNQTATEDEIRDFKQRMNALSQDNREAFLDKLREKLIRADEAAKVREVRDRQIARLKEEFRESKEKARERRVRSDLTATLKKGNDRIVQLLSRPTENAHVPVQLAQAVAEYAQRLNQLLTTSEPKTGEFAWMEKQTQKGALNAQKILDALKRSYADEETIAALKAEDPKFDPRGLLPVQYDENGHIVKDETLIKMINGMDSIIQGKHLSDLTEDELRFVLNTMRGVIHTVTEANKVTVQGEKRNVYRESRQMANEVNSATKVFGDKSNKITKFMNRYVIESLGLRRIAKLYSGSNEDAIFVKMVDDLNEGALEQERIKQTLRGMFNEVTTKYAKEMDTWYGKKAEWIDTGFGFKITKGMRVSLAMHILNAQNLRNVEKAGLRIPDMNAYRKGSINEAYKNGKVVRLTKEQAQQIVDNMTEAEKAYFEVAKEFFHKRSGFYINRTSLKLLGYSKAIVENYFPIQTDDAYRTVKYDDVRQNASVEHPGFLEARKGTANVMYLNDITAVVNRQIEGVAKYAGLAIPMRNWNNVMNAWLFEENENGEWVRSDEGRPHDVLERRMGYTNGKGKAIIDYVDQFITDLTSPGVRDANENVHVAEFAAKLTSNYVKSVLTLNLRVALSQTASVPTAAAEIPWKYLVQSFGGNVEQHLNRNASNELIDQYTQIFAMRRAGTQTEVSEVMKRRGFADKAEQKLPGLLGWITAMDVAATRRLWYACERWVKGETNIPVGSNAFYEEVARRYERVIQNTQPNFTVLQRSPALRSKSAAARIITMFGTQRMQNAGVFIESLAEVVQTKDKVKRKAAMKKFGRTLSGLITAAIVIGLERALVSALRGRMRPLQDEDNDITVGSVSKYIMGEIGTSLAGSFMYVGELYDFVHGVIGGLADGDSGYETSFALPAAEALSTTIKFFKDKDWQYFEYMRGDHTDHEKWLKTRSFVNELMTVASYVTGLPLANASKTILNGAVPLVQDIVESTKTGELNLYLHQSGKLDSAKTAENYKEWTNLGKKGSVYLAWENRFKEDKSNGLDHRAELLFEDSALTADEKAILLRMSNSTKDNPLTSKDGVVYKEDGTVVVDFTSLDRYRASTMLSDKQYEGFLNLVDMGVAEDVASTAFIQYNVQKKQGSGANDRFRDWLFATVKNPEDRAKVDMAVVGNTVRVEGTIGYKENGEVYADYSSKEMFDLYTSGKKQQKSDAIISTTDTPEAKAKAFADTDNDYHAKGGIVYNDKDKVVADFTSDEAYRASQMGESHYEKYNDAVKQGMSKDNAILAVEKHKEFTNDDDKDNATQYATWVFNTYKSAKDRAIAGAIYSSKPVTIKDGRTYDENGYIYRDYTSAAWYKLSNRTLSSDGTNKRYEAAKKLVDTGLTAERIVEIYEGTTGMSKKSEWKEYLKSLKLTNEQIDIFMKSRWK